MIPIFSLVRSKKNRLLIALLVILSGFFFLTKFQKLIEEEEKIGSAFVVVFVFSSVTDAGLARRDGIRSSWSTLPQKMRIEDSSVIIRFVVGLEGVSETLQEQVQGEQKVHNDIILLPVADTYAALTSKLAGSLTWAHRNLNFQYLMKVDDDTFVRLDAVEKTLRELDNDREEIGLYWGYFDGRAPVKRAGKWKEEKWLLCDTYLPYAVGGGYVLSSDLVQFVAENHLKFVYYNSEDVSLGAWLAPLQVTRVHDMRFDTQWASRGCLNSHIVSHKQTPQMMKDKFDTLLLSGGTKMCDQEFSVGPAWLYNYNWTGLPSKCCAKLL